SLLFSLSSTCLAAKTKKPVEKSEVLITAKSAVLMEQTTGKILFEKNSHEKIKPASVTKIMTLLLTMESIENKMFSYDTIVTATKESVSMGGSQIWLKEGEKMSVNDLIKATAVASANDAAFALAIKIGGTEKNFVAMMNARAKELEMNDTNFVNPTGLDEKDHITSAHDVAIMSRALLSKKDIKNYTSIWIDSLRGGKTSLVNTNKLVRFYKGCTGLKTGTTSGAGACVSASATQNNMDLISVIMNASDSKTRFNEARILLDYGFANFMLYSLKTKDENLPKVKVLNGTDKSISIKKSGDSKILIHKTLKNNIKEEIVIPEKLSTPIQKDQIVGKLKITISENEFQEVDLISTNNVEKMNFKNALFLLLKNLIS
ncbi:MAG: D-alanyl-D-alanine carboxypeptidase family protein, partial [Oscillospiraceae bacterium]